MGGSDGAGDVVLAVDGAQSAEGQVARLRSAGGALGDVVGLFFWLSALLKAATPGPLLALLLKVVGPDRALPVAIGLIGFEWLLGLVILTRWRREWVLAASAGVILAMSAVLIVLDRGGWSGPCGCLGALSPGSLRGSLVVNAVLLVWIAAAWQLGARRVAVAQTG